MVPNAALSMISQTTFRPGFHRRRDDVRVGAEAAVADQRDRGAIRLADLDPEHRRRAEAHRRQAARRDEGARHRDRELLRDAVLVPADVGDDEAVLGQRLAQLAEDALGPEGELVGGPLMRPFLRERPAPAANLVAGPGRDRGVRGRCAAAASAASASLASATTPSSVGRLRPISARSASM